MAVVRTAKEAVAVAKSFLSDAGHTFFLIIDAMEENGIWIVRALTLVGQMTIRIKADTSEVLELKRTGSLQELHKAA